MSGTGSVYDIKSWELSQVAVSGTDGNSLLVLIQIFVMLLDSKDVNHICKALPQGWWWLPETVIILVKTENYSSQWEEFLSFRNDGE